MTCRCGKKKAVQLGHCTECWIKLANYMFYLRQKEEGLWDKDDKPTEPPAESRPRPQ